MAESLIDQIIREQRKGTSATTLTTDGVTTTRQPSVTQRVNLGKTVTTAIPAKTTTTQIPAKTTTRSLPAKTSLETQASGTQLTQGTNDQQTVQTLSEDEGFQITFKIKIRGGLGGGATTPLCP